jgi:hypothetical protein
MSDQIEVSDAPKFPSEISTLDSLADKWFSLEELPDDKGRMRTGEQRRKEFSKWLLKFERTVHPEVWREIILDIFSKRKTLAGMLERLDYHMKNYNPAVELWRNGKQGMIIWNGEIHAIEMFAGDREDKKWGIENEGEIILQSIKAFMGRNNLDHIECQVMMFRNKGFSGSCDEYELVREPLKEGSVPIIDGFHFNPEDQV